MDVVNLRYLPPMEPMTEHFGALAELRDAGLIRHLGISGVTPEHLAQAQEIAPVVCVQNPYDTGRRRRSCSPAVSRASRSCRSSRSPAPAAGAAPPAQRPAHRWPWAAPPAA